MEHDIPFGVDDAIQNQTDMATKTNTVSKPLRQYNVVMHDSEHHTDAYVVKAVTSVCGASLAQAVEIVKAICTEGKAIVYSNNLEVCELKKEQLEGLGGDEFAAQQGVESLGSMTVTIEAV